MQTPLQGIESMHAYVNGLQRRLTARKDEGKLERILQLVNSATVNRDEYGDLLENDEDEETSEQMYPYPNDENLDFTDVTEAQTIFITLDDV